MIVINIAVFLLAEIFTGSTLSTSVLIRWGAARVSLIEGGQYWRLLTAMFLHSGIRHLLNNMLLLYVLGQHLEFLLGPVRYALLYIGCGLIANAVSLYIYRTRGEDIVFMGASGAIFAVMGALLYIVIRYRGRVQGLTLHQMVVMAAFSLYFGFVSSGVSNSAHVAGLISGFVSGAMLCRSPQPPIE
ncbi:MAG: rhomboid family intramembrane serine protease [Lachnospiraceae bacterium]|nr:rhomboid family intramembrane serine protease [Lachnospiraceae bacterium]